MARHRTLTFELAGRKESHISMGFNVKFKIGKVSVDVKITISRKKK